MTRRELTTLVAAVTIAVTTVTAAMAYVETRVADKVTHTEFGRYLEQQRRNNDHLIGLLESRLQSIEEAIRKK